VFEGFSVYWQPFLGGTGPAPSFIAGLSTDQRRSLEEALEGRLPVGRDGRTAL
jgi:hypothetical protein